MIAIYFPFKINKNVPPYHIILHLLAIFPEYILQQLYFYLQIIHNLKFYVVFISTEIGLYNFKSVFWHWTITGGFLQCRNAHGYPKGQPQNT